MTLRWFSRGIVPECVVLHSSPERQSLDAHNLLIRENDVVPVQAKVSALHRGEKLKRAPAHDADDFNLTQCVPHDILVIVFLYRRALLSSAA